MPALRNIFLGKRLKKQQHYCELMVCVFLMSLMMWDLIHWQHLTEILRLHTVNRLQNIDWAKVRSL